MFPQIGLREVLGNPWALRPKQVRLHAISTGKHVPRIGRVNEFSAAFISTEALEQQGCKEELSTEQEQQSTSAAAKVGARLEKALTGLWPGQVLAPTALGFLKFSGELSRTNHMTGPPP